MLQDYRRYSIAEKERWLHLRAIEWSGWATFISLPIVPVLLIFYPWYLVLIGLLCIDLAWQFVQHVFVSVRLSEISCLAVAWLQWPAAVGSSVWLIVQGRLGVGILALLWPLAGSFVTAPIDVVLGWFGIRRSIGSIELSLANKLGHAAQDAGLVQ